MLGRILGLAVAATCVGGLASCGGGDEVLTVDCATATVKPYAELTIIAKCTNCHASSRTNVDLEDKDTSMTSRHGATQGYDYETEELAKQTAAAAAQDVAGDGAHVMPPIDEPRHTDNGGAIPDATDAEKKDFIAWATCPAK